MFLRPKHPLQPPGQEECVGVSAREMSERGLSLLTCSCIGTADTLPLCGKVRGNVTQCSYRKEELMRARNVHVALVGE